MVIQRQTSNSVCELGAASRQILLALAQFHVLTVDQILRLFYKKSSRTTVQARMKALFDVHYCERRALPVPNAGRGGTGVYLYTLGYRGRAFVQQQGVDVPARFRPSELPRQNYLAHLVASTDVFVSAALLAQTQPGLRLERLLPERVLRAQKTRVVVEGKPRQVVPDGWFALRAEEHGHAYRYPIALELDLGSERQTKWRAKIAGLLAWLDGPYESLFQTRNATIAVVCPGRESRAAVLCAWTAAALSQLGRRTDATHFLFTGQDPATLPPERFFRAPLCLQPFAATPLALLDQEDAGA
jgi:hypothetical protein